MPRTLDEGFRDFLAELTPSTADTASAKSHRASIEQCLRNNYVVKRFFRTGSFGNGTSVYGYSDIDYFVSIPSANLSTDSDYVLRKLRDILIERFPRTAIAVRCPAVRIPFGSSQSEAHEIVPADSLGLNASGHEVFEIPNCAGAWMATSPDAHNSFVLSHNQRLSNRLKPLIRYLKAWKFYNSVPISSFYLEMRAAKFAAGEKSIIYSMDIRSIFTYLDDNALPALQDPTGVAGYIYPCSTNAKFAEARSKIATARKRADNAREAEDVGNLVSAFYWWDLFFGGCFPGYYYG
jgi:hypothetical protein